MASGSRLRPYSMERKISATELARRLSDVLSRVHYRGERFIIERNGEPVASVVPSVAPPGVTLRELADRLGSLAPVGDGFADDLEAMHTAQPRARTPEWPN